MKVTDIPKVLDLAKKARQQNRHFVPLFAGDAGIGKSEIIQSWAKSQGKSFGFIDCRLAYYEAPDMVGLPYITNPGTTDAKTFFATPSMWPTEGEGLLLLEEPNRANQSVLNTVMQLLTDRKIGDYHLPEGWVISAVINPDKPGYAVNTLDTALKDRFVNYDVLYDKETFVKFMKETGFEISIVNFIESNTWVYKSLDELGESQYIAPRTFSRLDAAEKTGVKEDSTLFYDTCVATLGKAIGIQYYKYVTETVPVTFEDFKKNKKAALKKLEEYKEMNRGDLLAVTVDSFVDGKAGVSEIEEVVDSLFADNAFNLIKKSITTGNITLEDVEKKSAKLKKQLVLSLKGKTNNEQS